ncbi:MAG: ferric reductase-like transmembrane domain-containing protein [Dehalococcoidia bacterium]
MTGLIRSRAVGILLVAASGALLLSTLGRTISLFESTEQPVLWWAGRASGFLAYLAMWLSMVFGTLVSAKSELLNKKLTMELHRQWSLAAVVATLVHVVVLVAHPDSGLSLLAGVVPFFAERLTGGVAVGVFSLWGLVLVIGSSLLQRRMPYAAWRAIHALSFGAMLLALVQRHLPARAPRSPWSEGSTR